MSTASSIPVAPRLFQFRLATLLLMMIWIGLASAALATPTRFWVSVMAVITLLSLFTSVLVIIYRTECVRAFAVGFLVFGGAYGALVLLIDARNAHGPAQETLLPTTSAISWFYMQYHAKNTKLWPGGGMGGMGGMSGMGGGMGGMGGGTAPAPTPFVAPRYLYQNLYPAAQFVFTMLIGILGGVIAKQLYLTRPGDRTDRGEVRP
jgi:hypothetical protein